MSAVYHPYSIYVARSTTGAPTLGEAAYARNRGRTSRAWLLMLVWHMPECCSCAIAHARQGEQLFRIGLHVSRLLVHLQHLGCAIARIWSVCHVLCVGHDKGARLLHEQEPRRGTGTIPLYHELRTRVLGTTVPLISRKHSI